MPENKSLGFKELVAIAVGGMVGGGIFTILGIAVSIVGFLAPFAIALGGIIAFLQPIPMSSLGSIIKMKGQPMRFINVPILTHLWQHHS